MSQFNTTELDFEKIKINLVEYFKRSGGPFRDFDFTGSIDVEGKEFLIGAWKKAPGAKDNAPVLKFSITPKTGGKATVDADPTPPPVTDEDIPF